MGRKKVLGFIVIIVVYSGGNTITHNALSINFSVFMKGYTAYLAA